MRSRVWLTVFSLTVGLMIGRALLVRQLVVGSVVEAYSPGWHSPTSAIAEEKRLLIARVAVQPDRVLLNGAEVEPLEAWVEPATRVEYRFFLFPRTIRDSQNLLIVHLRSAPEQTPYAGEREELVYGDSVLFDGYEGDYAIAGIKAAIPDTIHLLAATGR